MDDNPALTAFRKRHLGNGQQPSSLDTSQTPTINNDDALSISSIPKSRLGKEAMLPTHTNDLHRIATTKEEVDQLNREESVYSHFEPKDRYSYEGYTGWRSWRVCHPFKGIYYDIKRRLPYYRSDWTDAWTYRTIAGTIRIYFVNLLPALAYTLDMYRRTDQFYGVNEALLSSAIAATTFSLLSAQPITIVGVTGLISLFNYTIYDIIKQYDVTIYPQFMAWTGIWAAIMHWGIAIFNLCDYMRYVTDYSSETFGMYVGIVYMIKGVEELVDEYDRGPRNGFMAVMVALLYFASVYGLEVFGKGLLFNPGVRGFIADYAYPIATLFWVGFCYIPGNLDGTHLTRLPITKAFQPTQDRNWVIDFWNLDVKWVFAAIPFGLLITLLFYYDHNVSSLTCQAKQYPLKKPGGFHWDFFLLGCTTFVCGIIGVQLPNALIPQCPIHTDSLCNYQTDCQIVYATSTSDPSTQTDTIRNISTTATTNDQQIPEEIHRPIVRITSVSEQRVTHFLMALLFFGTMTHPLLTVLHTIPRAIFAGVFLTVGFGGLLSNGITQKLIFLLTEHRFIDPQHPLSPLPRHKILLYVASQMFAVAVVVAISLTIAAIGFPVLIMVLIPVRWVLFPRWFTVEELGAMDALTADNPVVLASFGGRPRTTGGMGLVQVGSREYRERKEGGVQRQRAGSFHR